jgi:DNA helicase TIP49 (TBP-interacting protein)
MFATFDTTALALANALMGLMNARHLEIARSLRAEAAEVAERFRDGGTMDMLAGLGFIDK